jgi:OOP family OmpA-OmpF porin
MKKLILGFACCLCCSIGHTQVVNPNDVAKDAATDRANGDIRSGINNAADKANEDLKNLFKKRQRQASDNKNNSGTSQPNPSGQSGTDGRISQSGGPLKAYNNYDFVPGERIVFEDHFADDQDGEFPSHWNLGAGQAVLNKVSGNEALLLTEGNFAHVSPLIKGATYLTDTFTIEFDCYTNGGYGPHLFFYGSTSDALHGSNDLAQVDICNGNIWEGVNVCTTDKTTVNLVSMYPPEIKQSIQNKWHHVAIAYKAHQLKVYMDQYRVASVPNLPINPRAIDIEGIGDAQSPVIIANFRIANGGNMNMHGRKFTAAKIITHGINFDVNKATLKPESMGTLNGIVQIMKENPDVKFEVGGHTDSDGGDAINLPLSQQRADSVRGQLVSMGISPDRLTAKGFGAGKPISDNKTLEGKANNRRVEFVKM